MGDACTSEGQVESPVETENDDKQKKRHDDVVDRLNGRHSETNCQAGHYHRKCMAQNWPIAILCMQNSNYKHKHTDRQTDRRADRHTHTCRS